MVTQFFNSFNNDIIKNIIFIVIIVDKLIVILILINLFNFYIN